MADEKLERIYTIPLGDAYKTVRKKRTIRAVDLVKSFLQRHMKARDSEVYVSTNLNELLWERGIQKPPRRVKVRAIKEGESLKAYLAEEKIEAKKPEPKKTDEKKEEAKAEPLKEEKTQETTESEKNEGKKADKKEKSEHKNDKR